MASRHKNKGVVNAWPDAQSTLNLDIQGHGNLTGFRVKNRRIRDNHGGVWKAVRSATGPKARDVRLIMTTLTPPVDEEKAKRAAPPKKDTEDVPPTTGTLTITLEKTGSTDVTVREDVDYVNDAPP